MTISWAVLDEIAADVVAKVVPAHDTLIGRMLTPDEHGAMLMAARAAMSHLIHDLRVAGYLDVEED